MIKPRIWTALATAICLTVVIAKPSCAATKIQTRYRIERVWFDTKSIYIYYNKSVEKISYSNTNIDGTILKEESTWFIKKLPKGQIGFVENINLLDESEPAEKVIYKDSDFKVLKNADDIVMLGKSAETTIQDCDNSIWSHGWPIRVHDRLFYCGVLMDTSGRKVWQVDELSTKALSNKPVTNQPDQDQLFQGSLKFTYCLSKGRVIAMKVNPLSTMSEVEMAIITIGTGGKVSWQNLKLPELFNGSDIGNWHREYSPSGGIIFTPPLQKGRVRDEIFLCDDASCQAIKVPVGYEDYDYVSVDSDNREIFFFTRKNVVTPTHTMLRTRY